MRDNQAAILCSAMADVLDDQSIQTFARVDRQTAIGWRFQKIAGDSHPATLICRRLGMASDEAGSLACFSPAPVSRVEFSHAMS
jgi:hypothetical protein